MTTIDLERTSILSGSGVGDRMDAVTEDRLLGGRVVLRQPSRGYRVAIDPVLLAAATPALAGQKILDLGCGVGAAALCLLHRVSGCRVVGLEVQGELLQLARDNAVHNTVAGDLTFVQADVADGTLFRSETFDHVMCNPPYQAAGRGRPPADPSRARANQEQEVSLADWLAFGLEALRLGGTMTLIHRADRLDDVLAAFSVARCAGERRFGSLVVFPLWPKSGRAAKRVLIQARCARRAPTRLAAGLVLHEADGRLSAAAEAVLRDAAELVP